MSHKTLVGGTAYNITSGKSMVSGTAYNITGGRTLVGGTGYNINFGGGGGGQMADTAMLYSDGNMVFQYGDDVESGKTLTASYTGFEDASYTSDASVPWNSHRANIKNVSFYDNTAPTSMAYWFMNCINLINFNKTNFNTNLITNMTYTYYNCLNLKIAICGPNVTNMYHTYINCRNLTTAVCGPNVTNMSSTYSNCRNLTTAVCGDEVRDMSDTYINCRNLTIAVCGPNVIYMRRTYTNCRKLTTAVCGPNVTTMQSAYEDDLKLITAVCGPNVTSMMYAYRNCQNLTTAIGGGKVQSMYAAYSNCPNIRGNAYFYSSSINSVNKCFYLRNSSNRLNIYVPSGSTTNTAVHYKNAYSLVGASITWTNAGSYQYNTAYNIYIYPVANVVAAAIANGDEEANANAGITIINEPTNNWTGGSN